MSLSAFLAQNAVRTEPVRFAVSPRFLGEDGEAEPWEIRCLTAGKVHFFEYVIVGAAHQNARFLYSHRLYKVKVLFVCPYPACDLGEIISQLLAFLHSLAVLFRIKEKLRLLYHTLFTAQLMHKLEQVNYLLYRKRRCGLLSVTECGIRHPDLFGHIHRRISEIERRLGNAVIVVYLPEQIGFAYVLQRGRPVHIRQYVSV